MTYIIGSALLDEGCGGIRSQIGLLQLEHLCLSLSVTTTVVERGQIMWINFGIVCRLRRVRIQVIREELGLGTTRVLVIRVRWSPALIYPETLLSAHKLRVIMRSHDNTWKNQKEKVRLGSFQLGPFTPPVVRLRFNLGQVE